MLNAEDNCFESIERDSAIIGGISKNYDKTRSSLCLMIETGKTHGPLSKRHRTQLGKERLEALKEK